jgi:hypothetical protein
MKNYIAFLTGLMKRLYLYILKSHPFNSKDFIRGTELQELFPVGITFPQFSTDFLGSSQTVSA